MWIRWSQTVEGIGRGLVGPLVLTCVLSTDGGAPCSQLLGVVDPRTPSICPDWLTTRGMIVVTGHH